jgi:hypothetical protein
LGIFWRALEWKMYILRPFWIFYGHFEYFTAIWYILLPFGIFCGNQVCFHNLMIPWYIDVNFGSTLPQATFIFCRKKTLSKARWKNVIAYILEKPLFVHASDPSHSRKCFITLAAGDHVLLVRKEGAPVGVELQDERPSKLLHRQKQRLQR